MPDRRGVPRESSAERVRSLRRVIGQLGGARIAIAVLLLREEGLDSCPQELWARYGEFMKAQLGIDDEHIFFCGMAIGYRDAAAPINIFPVPRVLLSETVAFEGF